jgi:hypothetical protein
MAIEGLGPAAHLRWTADFDPTRSQLENLTDPRAQKKAAHRGSLTLNDRKTAFGTPVESSRLRSSPKEMHIELESPLHEPSFAAFPRFFMGRRRLGLLAVGAQSLAVGMRQSGSLPARLGLSEGWSLFGQRQGRMRRRQQ